MGGLLSQCPRQHTNCSCASMSCGAGAAHIMRHRVNHTSAAFHAPATCSGPNMHVSRGMRHVCASHATSVRQISHDPVELHPTESCAWCSWFLLSFGCDSSGH